MAHTKKKNNIKKTEVKKQKEKRKYTRKMRAGDENVNEKPTQTVPFVPSVTPTASPTPITNTQLPVPEPTITTTTSAPLPTSVPVPESASTTTTSLPMLEPTPTEIENTELTNEENIQPLEPIPEQVVAIQENNTNTDVPERQSKWTFIICVFLTLLSFIPVGFGLYMIFKPNKYSQETDATVVNISCTGTHICNIEISYNVNNQVYNQKNIATSTIYAVGQKIIINYDPANPNNFTITQSKLTKTIIGAILVILGAILFIAIWLYFIYRK